MLRLEGEMLDAARQLEFERAASLRDRLDDVRAMIALGHAGPEALTSAASGGEARRPLKPGARPRRSARRGREI